MDQRCEIILQNYIYTQLYNTDYEIVNNRIIKYKNIILFYLFDKTDYIKYNLSNEVIKEYSHKYCYYYFNNNKNNQIYYNNKIKIIYTNKEEKHYNKFCKMYKKKTDIYRNFGSFKYYSIKPFIIYIYKTSINYYNKQKLYSNHYSIMFLLYIFFDYIIIYYIYGAKVRNYITKLYIYNQEYNTDYEIINNCIIEYRNITLFYLFNKTDYLSNEIQKGLIILIIIFIILIIYYLKNTKIKIIYNNKEEKHYNKFCTIYKKIINIYSNYVYFKYYSIKPFIIYIYIKYVYFIIIKPYIQPIIQLCFYYILSNILYN